MLARLRLPLTVSRSLPSARAEAVAVNLAKRSRNLVNAAVVVGAADAWLRPRMLMRALMLPQMLPQKKKTRSQVPKCRLAALLLPLPPPPLGDRLVGPPLLLLLLPAPLLVLRLPLLLPLLVL